MLLQEPVNHNLHAGISLNKPCIRDILARMVNAIAKTPHVIDDSPHQIVIRPLSSVKDVYLLFQKVEQPSEIDVIGMPYGK